MSSVKSFSSYLTYSKSSLRAEAGAEDVGADKGGPASGHVDDAGAGKVDAAREKRVRVSGLLILLCSVRLSRR